MSVHKTQYIYNNNKYLHYKILKKSVHTKLNLFVYIEIINPHYKVKPNFFNINIFLKKSVSNISYIIG